MASPYERLCHLVKYGILRRKSPGFVPVIPVGGRPVEITPARPANDSEVVDRALLFPQWPPPGPSEILANRSAYIHLLMLRSYRAPKGILQDSPLYGLYRLYEWVMAGDNTNLRNELECFWWARWPVDSIPDPGGQDDDPERYAVLASIPGLLVESFNARNDHGLRRAEPSAILAVEEQLAWAATPKVYEAEPAWAVRAAPLATTLLIPDAETTHMAPVTSLDDPDAAPSFRARNIVLAKPHIHFI